VVLRVLEALGLSQAGGGDGRLVEQGLPGVARDFAPHALTNDETEGYATLLSSCSTSWPSTCPACSATSG
jgi:hypothetical protein